MQHSLNIEPLPQFASHQADSSFGAQASSSGEPLCGAFDALTGFLLLGCSSGAVSCLHLGRYGSTARRVLGRHAGRVTAACLFPWQAPEHIAAAATVVPCARTASFFATCSADATIKMWTSDPKALHTTDACLQTLRGHRAAVTSLAAVQVSTATRSLRGRKRYGLYLAHVHAHHLPVVLAGQHSSSIAASLAAARASTIVHPLQQPKTPGATSACADMLCCCPAGCAHKVFAIRQL